MAAPTPLSRDAVTLSVGARVGAVLSLLLVILAVYLFWSPLQIIQAEGFPIRCGSAAKPPGDDLGKSVCATLNASRQWQAGSVVVAAAVLCLGSLYAFGFGVRRAETSTGTAGAPERRADEGSPFDDASVDEVAIGEAADDAASADPAAAEPPAGEQGSGQPTA